MSDEPEVTEHIQANTTFYQAAKISKRMAEVKRISPDIGKMVGVCVSWRMASGDTKKCNYYWATKKEMKEKLPHILSRYVNPIVEYIK